MLSHYLVGVGILPVFCHYLTDGQRWCQYMCHIRCEWMVAEKVNESSNPSYMTAHHTQTVTSWNGTPWIEMIF